MNNPIQKNITHQDGLDEIVSSWTDIMLLPVSDAEKTKQCVEIVQDHIAELKARNAHKKNPQLRFYADAIVLYELLLTESENRKFCDGAVRFLLLKEYDLLLDVPLLIQPTLDISDGLFFEFQKLKKNVDNPKNGISEFLDISRKWNVVDDLRLGDDEKIYQSLLLYQDALGWLALFCSYEKNPMLRFHTFILEKSKMGFGLETRPVCRKYIRGHLNSWLANNGVAKAYPFDRRNR